MTDSAVNHYGNNNLRIILIYKVNYRLAIETLDLRQQLAIMKQSIHRPKIRKRGRPLVDKKVQTIMRKMLADKPQILRINKAYRSQDGQLTDNMLPLKL